MSDQADFELDSGVAAKEPAPKPAPKRKPLTKKPSAETTAKAPAKKPAAKKPAPAEKAPAKKPSPPVEDGVIGGNAKAELKAFKDAILALEEEKAEVAAEIKEKYDQAKAAGFDTKILRKVIAAAKRDPKDVEDERAMFDLYADAAGIYAKMES